MAQKFIIALDIGGTKINSGLIDQTNHKITARQRRSSGAKKNKIIILNNIFQTIDQLLDQSKMNWSQISFLGIGIAGQVDYRRGIFISGPNFSSGFKKIPLKKILEKKYRRPVFIDNDGHCFALGESIFGQGRLSHQVIGLTLGTGIGGGFVLDKKIYRGQNNLAGEIGHMVIDAKSRQKCSCQGRGHFEALASGRALSQIYKKLTRQKINAQAIEERFALGQKSARQAVSFVSKSLALGLNNLINILNPEIIVVGGGLVRFRALWQLMLRELERQKTFRFAKTKIVQSSLGDDANLLGAAALAQNK